MPSAEPLYSSLCDLGVCARAELVYVCVLLAVCFIYKAGRKPFSVIHKGLLPNTANTGMQSMFVLTSVLEEIEEWDSLSALSLMAEAKKSYGKKLSADEINNFVTVQDIIDYLQK